MARKRVYGKEVSDVATVGIDLDEAGSAEVVPISVIQVDEAYQRDLRYDLVNQIAQNYDIVKAGPILLNERLEADGGGIWCVDGQHRMGGAAQAGEEEIFAHVVHGLTVAQEAELRLARNDRRSDNVFEKFRTRLVMGEEKAEKMVELVRQQGFRLNTSLDTHEGINALRSAEALYDAGPGDGVWLGRTLAFMAEAFGEEAKSSRVTGSNMLKAVAWFLDKHLSRGGDVSRTQFITKLRNEGIDALDRQARSYKAINGGSLWLNYYRAMVGIWNQGRQEKNKIEAKTLGSIMSLGDSGATKQGVKRPSPGDGDSGAGYRYRA